MFKNILSIFVLSLFLEPSFAATQNNQSRRSMNSQMVMSAPRVTTASTSQISNMAVSVSTQQSEVDKSSVRVEPITTPSVPVVDNREKEKAACINNNIGFGNTFVWASRYSNSGSYSSMVEDIEEPENNICFVKVELKSNDSNINVADIPSRYFQMGSNIVCGEWADQELLRQRILDAKKKTRVWASVGGAVGGAGIGVGAMELFGNRLIGGKLEGQKDLSENERLLSHLLVLKRDKDPQYNSFIDALTVLKEECKKIENNGGILPEECKKGSKYDYDYLLNAKNIN